MTWSDRPRLSDVLDPEDYSDAMHAYYDACARVIDGLGGWIADYLGDGLVVYSGYPDAHEDDPIRAVRAGLRLVDAVSDIRLQLSTSGGGLACRIGIETGLVVIGETGTRPREPIWALGRTTNVAARLQGIGSPNSVVIGEGTRALVTGWFELEPLGQHSIKGIAEPIDPSLVAGETGAKDRVGASFPRNLAPLVDREDELSTLLDLWRGAESGRGRALLLRGEAGIGKSRPLPSVRASRARRALPPSRRPRVPRRTRGLHRLLHGRIGHGGSHRGAGVPRGRSSLTGFHSATSVILA